MASTYSEIEKGSCSSTEPALAKLLSNTVIVGAIDFGTTYSGIAYSLRDDFIKDRTKVASILNMFN